MSIYAQPPKKPNSPQPTKQAIDIVVEFSDELLLETSGLRGALPTLSLNNGGEALLVAGTGTREWIFSYDFVGDNGTEISALDVANNSFTAINCTGECRASNWNGATADLMVSHVSFRLALVFFSLAFCFPFRTVEPALTGSYLATSLEY